MSTSTTPTYKSISQLSSATTINDNDILLISQHDGEQLISKKTTVEKLINLLSNQLSNQLCVINNLSNQLSNQLCMINNLSNQLCSALSSIPEPTNTFTITYHSNEPTTKITSL